MCDSTSVDVSMDSGVSISGDRSIDTSTETDESLLSSGPTLDHMPIEIFLHICSFLDGKVLSESLRLVCKRFYAILNDDNLWKLFVHKETTPNLYPILPSILSQKDFTWEEAYIELESEKRNWFKYANKKVLTSVLRDVHYSDVDAVLLLNEGRTCVSGSRDRGLAVWNINQIFGELQTTPPTPTCLKTNAHSGWVWDLAYHDNTLYSCSWDNTVKKWSLEEGLRCTDTYNCERTVLSVVCDENVLAAGLYSSTVMLFDPRATKKPVNSYRAHSRPVLSVVMTDRIIISGSEDKTVAVWDRRAGKILKKDIPISSDIEYPMCMSISSGSLFVGDNRSNIHLVDPTNFTVQPFYKKIAAKENDRIVRATGIKNGYGSVISCCDNGHVSVLSPTIPNVELSSIQCEIPRASALDYQNNVLTVACESAVQVWLPMDHPMLNVIPL